MTKLEPVARVKGEMSARAIEAGEKFLAAAEADDVVGYALVYIGRDNGISCSRSFTRRLEMIGAVESLKFTIWDAS